MGTNSARASVATTASVQRFEPRRTGWMDAGSGVKCDAGQLSGRLLLAVDVDGPGGT